MDLKALHVKYCEFGRHPNHYTYEEWCELYPVASGKIYAIDADGDHWTYALGKGWWLSAVLSEMALIKQKLPILYEKSIYLTHRELAEDYGPITYSSKEAE